MIRLVALAGTITISFSAIFVRLADVSPGTAAFYRAVYALPLLLVARWLVTDTRSRRHRLLAFAAGALLAIDLMFWHVSIEYIGAGLSTVIANTQVLWVGLLAWFLLGEKPSRTAFAIVPVVLIGITLIGGLGRADAFGSDPLRGTLLALAAGITYSGFLLVFRASNRDLVPTAGPLLDATAGAAVALLIVAPFDNGFSFAFSWPSHGWLLLLALLVQGVGWLLIATALPRLPAVETSVMLLLQPAATVLWAQLLFTEDLSVVQWAGVAIVLVGIAAFAIQGVGEVRRAAAATRPGP